jgi:protein gp37
MSVRKSIGWADVSISPITGCQHGINVCFLSDRCWYRCFGKRFKTVEERFPQIRPDRLKTIPGQGKRVAVGLSGDMWGKWVHAGWIEQVLDWAGRQPQHTFLFLTKNPQRYTSYLLRDMIPDNCQVGATIIDTVTLDRWMSSGAWAGHGAQCWASIEPFTDRFPYEAVTELAPTLNWAAIGYWQHQWMPLGSQLARRCRRVIKELQAVGCKVYLKRNATGVLTGTHEDAGEWLTT